MDMIFVTAARRNFTVFAGSTFSDSFVVKRDDGTPFDLTGWKARMKGPRYPEDATPMLDLSTDNGKIVLGGAAGTVNMTETVAGTRAWGRTTIEYQFEFEDAGGRVQTYFYGDVVVKAEKAR